jgi:integrase
MARIFKPTYTAKARGGGRVTKTARKWYVEYRDADGIVRRKAGYNDKAATQQLAAQLAREAEGLKSGLIDRCSEHRKRPLRDHVADWKSALLSKGATEKYVAMSVSRVEAILDGTNAAHWPELDAGRVSAFLAELRQQGLSVESSNHYLRRIKQFARWMVTTRRAVDSPLSCLSLQNARADVRRDRRPLTGTELVRLLAQTKTGPPWRGMTGLGRAMLYLLAVETGLRANELRTLTWGAFNLDADLPTVTVLAAYSKHRRDDTLPLRASTARVLAAWRGNEDSVVRDAQTFPTMPERTADMLRQDLRRARAGWIRETLDRKDRRKRRKSSFLATVDETGRVVDFHALRHTFITNLARGGVHPKIAQSLARHSTITLTMDRYSHTVIGEQADALCALPDLTPDESAPQQNRATGTYDATPDFLASSLAFCLPERGSPTEPVSSSPCAGNPESRGRHADRNLLLPFNVGQRDSASVNDMSQLGAAGLEPATSGLKGRCSTD